MKKKNHKKEDEELHPLVSIENDIFDSDSKYTGLWLHTRDATPEDIHIGDHIIHPPEEGEFKTYVDTNEMKDAVIESISKSDRKKDAVQITVYTLMDLQDKIEALERKVENLELLTVKSYVDFQKDSFWEPTTNDNNTTPTKIIIPYPHGLEIAGGVDLPSITLAPSDVPYEGDFPNNVPLQIHAPDIYVKNSVYLDSEDSEIYKVKPEEVQSKEEVSEDGIKESG